MIKSLLKEVMEAVPMNFNIPVGVAKYSIYDYVISFLTKNKIPYKDLKGNIYSLNNQGKPLLSAHMDSVGSVWPSEGEALIFKTLVDRKEILPSFNVQGKVTKGGVFETKKEVLISRHGLNIGADDKAGVAIALAMLLKDKELNFIFSRQEETHPRSVNEVIKEVPAKDFEHIPYCLVLDRKGSSDIIGLNKYCCKDFIDALEAIEGFNYKDANGSISDGNDLMAAVPTVNLSVGYYQPHSEKEYIDVKAWFNALNYVRTITKTLTKRYELYKVKTNYHSYSSNYYPNYSNTSNRKKSKSKRTSSIGVITKKNGIQRYFSTSNALMASDHGITDIIAVRIDGVEYPVLKQYNLTFEDYIYTKGYRHSIHLESFKYFELYD